MSIKGQDHSLTLPKVTVFKLTYVFLKTVEIFKTKYHVKDFGSTEMKIYTNGLGHIPRWPPCPYMVKPLSRASGPIAMKLGM